MHVSGTITHYCQIQRAIPVEVSKRQIFAATFCGVSLLKGKMSTSIIEVDSNLVVLKSPYDQVEVTIPVEVPSEHV